MTYTKDNPRPDTRYDRFIYRRHLWQPTGYIIATAEGVAIEGVASAEDVAWGAMWVEALAKP